MEPLWGVLDSVETCEVCSGVGYRGRTAMMEHAIVSSAVKRAIRENADERGIAACLRADGYRSLREIAEGLARDGVTDRAEVIRALGPADDEPPAGAAG